MNEFDVWVYDRNLSRVAKKVANFWKTKKILILTIKWKQIYNNYYELKDKYYRQKRKEFVALKKAVVLKILFSMNMLKISRTPCTI